MKKFSIKPKVEALEIEADGQQVFVRQLSAGDKVALSEQTSKMATLASKVQDAAGTDNPDDLATAAKSVLSPEQLQAFMKVQAELVWLRWCDKNGKQRFPNRSDFDAVPAVLVDAIYTDMSALELSEKDAEKNS